MTTMVGAHLKNGFDSDGGAGARRQWEAYARHHRDARWSLATPVP
jgi:hypothetical protein